MFVVETHGSGGGGPGGSGKLTVDVSFNGRSVPAKIAPDGENRYHVSFQPIGSGIYTVRVHYAGVEVTGMILTGVGGSMEAGSQALECMGELDHLYWVTR